MSLTESGHLPTHTQNDCLIRQVTYEITKTQHKSHTQINDHTCKIKMFWVVCWLQKSKSEINVFAVHTRRCARRAKKNVVGISEREREKITWRPSSYSCALRLNLLKGGDWREGCCVCEWCSPLATTSISAISRALLFFENCLRLFPSQQQPKKSTSLIVLFRLSLTHTIRYDTRKTRKERKKKV